MILTIRLVLHIKWAVLLKSITLILLFVCCTQPCLFGEFESSSGLWYMNLWRIACLQPTLSFWISCDAMLGLSFQSESATVYLWVSLNVSAAHMQWLQKPFFYIIDNLHCILLFQSTSYLKCVQHHLQVTEIWQNTDLF